MAYIRSVHICYSTRLCVPTSSACSLVSTNNTNAEPYFRIISVDLRFDNSPKDLMRKFMNCLVRLCNLKTLEIFSTTHAAPIARRSARFPSIRELVITNSTVQFVRNCPNVEVVTVLDQLYVTGALILHSHRKGLKELKRVVGVVEGSVWLGETYSIIGSVYLPEVHHESCARLSEPPGDRHQGYNERC